jgi:anti-sigma factor RsiW
MERLTGHAELQELLGAYALDAVEADEAAAIERHLPTCPRCRTELADHREVAALLGYAGGSAPSGLWDRIVASLEEPPPALRLTRSPIQDGRPSADAAAPRVPSRLLGETEWDRLPSVPANRGGPLPDQADSSLPDSLPDLDTIAGRWGPKTPPPIHARTPPPDSTSPGHADNVVPIGRGRPRRKVEMRLMVALASAAAVIVAALGIQVGRLDVRKPQQANLPELAYRVADADPHARHLTLSSSDGVHTIRAVIIADGTTYLGPGNLDQLPADETYQMWGVVDGARVSLGVVGNSPTYHAFTTPAVANVLAVTVEPRGGVVSSTNTPVVAGVVPTA